ncbi:hypothetical protein N7471_001756 [Penicillium samsonianum]|uniref:uncharacterized protein n=1 Tax=Penicillium samsonianum TaxID=1882272 RepID=UPI0025477B23|nr:uncharacterized protein N7471_001756 [Penicillium samsonianum]KAJ6150557.1 hypothetical protein N7471_001756 [Penicillium samsonianum]
MTAHDINFLLSQLSPEEKVSLLAGVDGWQTQEVARLGIGSLKMTDGPSGARGKSTVDGPTSAFLPAPVAQAATWSTNAVRAIGRLLCEEAKTKAAQVLLAPTICCARNPLGGRNFESFSEDPLLSGKLAIEYIRGVQESGEVGATVKHFVANEQEDERFNVNANVTERALREIYLRPFEMTVKSSSPPTCVMTAYNCVNGLHMDMNRKLLTETLRNDWGFDGVIMSDWGGTNSLAESLLAGLDLEMPGPAAHRGAGLLALLQRAPSEEILKAIDASCSRVLQLLAGKNLLGLSANEAMESRKRTETSSYTDLDRQLLRSVAAEGIVLLKNSKNILPLSPDKIRGKRVAFIGPNSLHGAPGGGGSSSLNPHYQTHPMEAFSAVTASLGIKVDVQHTPGAFSYRYLPLAATEKSYSGHCEHTMQQKGMLRLDFFASTDFSGPILETQYRNSSNIDLSDTAPAVVYEKGDPYSFRLSTTITPKTTGMHTFGIANVGNARLYVNNHLLIDNHDWSGPAETFYSFGSTEKQGKLHMTAGRAYEVCIESSSKISTESDPKKPEAMHVYGIQPSVRFGFLEQLPENPISDAVVLADGSDFTILILGLNEEWEGEGHDRTTMSLPGTQDELAQSLLRSVAHPENIVIVNQSGSPVEMCWEPEANTIVQTWYGGQEAGNALCDVLIGRVNPSGRLPISWPFKYTDLHFHKNKHTWPGIDGQVVYAEETFVGYRWYLHQGVKPRYWFGYGLGYSTFDISGLETSETTSGWDFIAEVSNTGNIPGREIVQLYSTILDGAGVRELRSFEKTRILAVGETQKVTFSLEKRDLAHWNGRWITEKCVYLLEVGKNAGDKNMLTAQVRIDERIEW